MTLQERLLASAKELVRLLEESQKEHEEKIRERDRKLLGEWDNSAEEMKLPGGLGLQSHHIKAQEPGKRHRDIRASQRARCHDDGRIPGRLPAGR